MTILFRGKSLLILSAIILLYFSLRIPNLTLQPIFADEAIYIRWAQVMRAEPTLRFLPLLDGKTPLFMWLLMPTLKVLSVLGVNDPLFAGRFLSVVAGLFTLGGVYFVGKKVFSNQVGLWAAFLYAVTPYTVFFDRMALTDSMLCAFLIWSLYFAIRLVEERRLDLSMILGFLLGGSILTKTPALMSILSLPIILVSLKFTNNKRTLLKSMMYFGLSLFICAVIYNLLRLGPNFQMLSSRNSDYIFPFDRIFTHPLDPLVGHVKELMNWWIRLIGPGLLFILYGIWVVLKRVDRVGIAILIWAFVPMFFLLIYLQTFTARYLLFTLPTLLIIASVGIIELLNRLKTKHAVIGLLVLLSIWPISFDVSLLTSPQNSPLPNEERRGYLEDWTAGYGFKEIAEFLVDMKTQGGVVVGTEGFFGTLPEGLQIYLDKSDIPVIGSRASVSAQLRNAAKDNQTYFVGNKNRLPTSFENATLIKEYTKAIPRGNFPRDAIQFYQIFPE